MLELCVRCLRLWPTTHECVRIAVSHLLRLSSLLLPSNFEWPRALCRKFEVQENKCKYFLAPGNAKTSNLKFEIVKQTKIKDHKMLDDWILQEHPLCTWFLFEFAGQTTAEQERLSKGLVVAKMADTDPVKPALREHPLCTWSPFDFARKTTAAEHEPP